MTKAEVNEKLKELLKGEMSNNAVKEARDLRDRYQAAAASEHKKQLEKFLEEGGEKEDFIGIRNEEDKVFDELWSSFSQKQKQWETEEADKQENNLKRKQAILDKIADITENEENIKNAFNTVKELENEWKEAGSVPAKKFNELQAEYSRVRDEFYYNMRIYKELFEHDLKRNLQLKQELAEKMETLIENPAIKETESLVKTYLKEWDETGPTFKEEWEGVRDRFRGAQKKVFERIREHYRKVKNQHLENLEQKEKLCEEAENILKEDITTKKRWNKLTDRFKELQREWKKIGFAPREKNEEIWQRFKKAGDEFFARKSDFFKGVKEQQNKNRDAKLGLIAEAEALQDSEEWNETSEKLKAVQRKWKKIGGASQRDEQKLWKRFRSACNRFFERKKEYFATKSDREAENLEAKRAIIEKLNKFELGEDQKENFNQVEAIAAEFNAIGFVPIKEKSAILNDYHNTLQSLYNKMGLSKSESQKLLFRNKLKDIKEGGNKKAFEREESHIQNKIKELDSTIKQYETNINFFGPSKGAEKLREEVEQKLDKTREQLDFWKKKLDMLYDVKETGEVSDENIEDIKDAAEEE